MVQRTERMSEFNTDSVPDAGVRVQALAEDHVGTYLLPFLCLWTGSGWSNADTSLALDADIVGWRLLPRKTGLLP